MVRRLTPFLLHQARLRWSPAMQSVTTQEDLVQDVWLSALPKLATFDVRGDRATPALTRWLGRILINRLNDLFKSLARRLQHGKIFASTTLLRTIPNLSLHGIEQAIREEASGKAARALDRLEPLDRSIVIRHLFDGMTFEQIARKDERSRDSVAKRYQRALKKLEDTLGAGFLDGCQ